MKFEEHTKKNIDIKCITNVCQKISIWRIIMVIKLKELLTKELSKQELLVEIGKIHISLESGLNQYARNLGYTVSYKFPHDKIPDVCLRSATDKLFIGDAKDSFNEKPSHKETSARITKYIKIATEMLKNNLFKEIAFAIATDDEETAFLWKDWLTEKCNELDLNFPMFVVEELAESGYIIIDEHVSE
jgi:hypothetical protein